MKRSSTRVTIKKIDHLFPLWVLFQVILEYLFAFRSIHISSWISDILVDFGVLVNCLIQMYQKNYISIYTRRLMKNVDSVTGVLLEKD